MTKQDKTFAPVANEALLALLRSNDSLRSADPIYGAGDTVEAWWVSARTPLGDVAGITHTGVVIPLQAARLVQRAVKAGRLSI